MNTHSPDPDRPFDKVWKARAHAMAVRLSEAGVFTWAEWTKQLGEELKGNEAGTEADQDEAYYVAWQNALERIVLARQVMTENEYEHFHHAWENAFRRTPHGKPIELTDADFGHSPAGQQGA